MDGRGGGRWLVRWQEGFALEAVLRISFASRERVRLRRVTVRAAVEARLPMDTWPPEPFAAVFAKFLWAVAVRQ